MGNRHSKWFPEVVLTGWTRHSEERYIQRSAWGSRSRSRKASRKCVFLETIEEERLISEDRASARNNLELLLLQATETHPVAHMLPETSQAPDVNQPAALMDQKGKEAQVKMKIMQEAKSAGEEQPYSVTSPFAEDVVLPERCSPGTPESLMGERASYCFYNRVERENPEEAETEERVSYCFYNRAMSENPEEAKIVQATVWNVDDLTPEDEGHLFEHQERATKKEIPAPVKEGIDGLHCEDAAVQSRDAKKTGWPQETEEEEDPLVLEPRNACSPKFLHLNKLDIRTDAQKVSKPLVWTS
ncbi:UNVERIFIED_CONTAM: hypothetical protein K2H54_016127 [Gekko kuhli]